MHKYQRNRVFSNSFGGHKEFWKKPGFWPHIKTKETGFLAIASAVTKNSGKNPVSGHASKPKKPGFSQFFGGHKEFWKKPGFWPRLKTKETGFLAISSAVTKDSRKKPGFWPRLKTKETGFFAVFRRSQRILEKTRFLATPQNQRNRVFSNSFGCHKEFSQKPGFWPRLKTKETGFFAVFRRWNDILGKNPVSADNSQSKI